jgi:hypothetical protein
VVIADPDLRPVVVWTLDELELEPVVVRTWREGVAWPPGRPALALYDLDQHPSADDAGLRALVARRWADRSRSSS